VYLNLNVPPGWKPGGELWNATGARQRHACAAASAVAAAVAAAPASVSHFAATATAMCCRIGLACRLRQLKGLCQSLNWCCSCSACRPRHDVLPELL
jgi:hypothetical protein